MGETSLRIGQARPPLLIPHNVAVTSRSRADGDSVSVTSRQGHQDLGYRWPKSLKRATLAELSRLRGCFDPMRCLLETGSPLLHLPNPFLIIGTWCKTVSTGPCVCIRGADTNRQTLEHFQCDAVSAACEPVILTKSHQ